VRKSNPKAKIAGSVD